MKLQEERYNEIEEDNKKQQKLIENLNKEKYQLKSLENDNDKNIINNLKDRNEQLIQELQQVQLNYDEISQKFSDQGKFSDNGRYL